MGDDYCFDAITINCSTLEMKDDRLHKELMNIIRSNGIDSSKIRLELTESATVHNLDTVVDNMEALNRRGVRFYLDDFGTGYSNMQRVASLPLSIVKLDKDFANMSTDSKYEIVLRNMIRMIKDMNLKIVVEGIETAGLAEQFSQLECEYIQGFFYSKPLPKDEFVEFIRKENHQ